MGLRISNEVTSIFYKENGFVDFKSVSKDRPYKFLERETSPEKMGVLFLSKRSALSLLKKFFISGKTTVPILPADRTLSGLTAHALGIWSAHVVYGVMIVIPTHNMCIVTKEK